MSEDVKPRQFYIVESENYNKPPYLDSHRAYHCKQAMYENIHVIELEPTLQLMKEMCETLKENGLSHDFDCGISVNGRHECSCGYLKSKEVLEKYRKFLEGIK